MAHSETVASVAVAGKISRTWVYHSINIFSCWRRFSELIACGLHKYFSFVKSVNTYKSALEKIDFPNYLSLHRTHTAYFDSSEITRYFWNCSVTNAKRIKRIQRILTLQRLLGIFETALSQMQKGLNETSLTLPAPILDKEKKLT